MAVTSTTGANGGRSRRELAVSRVSDPARAKAEQGVQRFLDAALELLTADAGKDFTVQEVVERSGQSLRSFYQYFDGKYELLLALFEDAVSTTTEQLRVAVEPEPTPLDRLRRFAIEYYRQCRPTRKGKNGKRGSPLVMAEFAQQLLTEHPHEAFKAFAPLNTLCEGLLEDAARSGTIRSGLDFHRMAGVVLQAIMFNAFATTISGTAQTADDTAAEELWDLLINGLGTAASGRAS